MNPQQAHERVSEVFLEVRAIPPAQRLERLKTLAAGDEALEREVRSLLNHDEAVTSDLSVSDDGSAHRLMHESVDLPARIGPYRILKRIGRGGSGYVMLAEQDEPVHRRVAVKIVPHAAIDPDFAARFEVERKALERTEHPNIARILDAGRTGEGVPYLVMDFVEGEPITDFCWRTEAPLRRRIELVLDVADAVQHAHQRGVIHRDLKPANILVGDVGGRPAPRVLDFGIAKPIHDTWLHDEGRGSEYSRAPATLGAPLGTPAYMAPEQTGLTGGVDTRADVYALAAVLYELVCGHPPNDVTSGDPVTTLRYIREIDPPPASRVRAKQPDRFSRDAVASGMLTDLDCILARALAKSPARRYASIGAFADDLRRLLRREPIEARAPTFMYRASRFVQRNAPLVAAATVAAVAVVAGFVLQEIQRAEAVRQHAEAQIQTESQREINRFLTDDLLAAASPEEQGSSITALELLHRASARVDERFALRPLVAASVHHTLGVAYTALGAFDDAGRHLDRAIALRTTASGPNAPDTIRSHIAAASLLARRQRLDEADAALTSAIVRAQLILGNDDPALFAAMNDLGALRETQDRGKEAVDLLEQALAGRRRLLGERDPQVLMTMSHLAMAYERVGDDERALQLQIDALKVAEQIEPPPQMTLIGLNNNVGATFQDLSRDAEAEPYLRKAAELAQHWLGAEHPDTLTIKSNLAGLEAELGDVNGALALLDEVIRIRSRDLGPRAWDTLTARYAYWNAMWKGRHFAEASEGLLSLLPDAIAALDDEHWFVAQTRAALALTLLEAGQTQDALPYAQRAVDQFMKVYGAEHARTINATRTLNSIRARLDGAARPPS